MEKIELNIEGMHCSGCSTRLQKILSNLDGVQVIDISFETGKANLEVDFSKVKMENIKEAIEDAGFSLKGE